MPEDNKTSVRLSYALITNDHTYYITFEVIENWLKNNGYQIVKTKDV